MSKYILSNEADNDLSKIYRYSYENFGEYQADNYLYQLDKCLNELANHPDIGQNIGTIQKGYFKYTCEKHVIFYEKQHHDIFVLRILHGRMNFILHL